VSNDVVQTSAGLGLTGQCNQCGLCCAGRLPDGTPWQCSLLEVQTELGQSGGTRCLLYRARYDGMPIDLLLATGERRPGKCTRSSPAETAIILRQIGKGCSLRPVTAEVPIGVFVPTTAKEA
jgi:hypothetical protein